MSVLRATIVSNHEAASSRLLAHITEVVCLVAPLVRHLLRLVVRAGTHARIQLTVLLGLTVRLLTQMLLHLRLTSLLNGAGRVELVLLDQLLLIALRLMMRHALALLVLHDHLLQVFLEQR